MAGNCTLHIPDTNLSILHTVLITDITAESLYEQCLYT